MKQIGAGWQYKVYDLGNGRVRKIKYSGLGQYLKILFAVSRIFPRFVFAKREQDRVNRMGRESNNYIISILKKVKPTLLGCPVFINTCDYEQEKVEILANFFARSDTQSIKEVLFTYIKTVQTAWEYGFSDCVFKFGTNNGIDGEGNVIQIDFGEITSDRSLVECLIKEEEWLKSSSYKYLPSKELKEYYRVLTTKEFTSLKLEEHWGRAL